MFSDVQVLCWSSKCWHFIDERVSRQTDSFRLVKSKNEVGQGLWDAKEDYNDVTTLISFVISFQKPVIVGSPSKRIYLGLEPRSTIRVGQRDPTGLVKTKGR